MKTAIILMLAMMIPMACATMDSVVKTKISVKIEDGNVLHISGEGLDWRKTLNSLNHGKPLSQVAPWSGLRKDFQKLATQIDKYISNGSTKGW